MCAFCMKLALKGDFKETSFRLPSISILRAIRQCDINVPVFIDSVQLWSPGIWIRGHPKLDGLSVVEVYHTVRLENGNATVGHGRNKIVGVIPFNHPRVGIVAIDDC